ncbi:DnaA N-terminal domain-containing protein, partial [Falsiroseomonas oryzae]|uniref:DnaA N-terminal domain-containing protein n=1 Tax=Falsiroseomonas oryzae TaxID=2766473 RepID=UPI0038CC15E7
MGEVEYRSWLRQMTLSSLQGEEVVVLLPTRFLRDWVRGHYGDRLQALWQAELPAVRRVEFRVMPEARADAQAVSALTPAAPGGPRNGRPDGVEGGLAEPLGRAAEPRLADTRAEARPDRVEWS